MGKEHETEREMGKQAYITGATGAIGMALIAALLKNNYEVTALVRPDSARYGALLREFALYSRFHVAEADLRQLGSLEKLEGISPGRGQEKESTYSKDTNGPEKAEREGCWQRKTAEAENNMEMRAFFHLGWNGTFGALRDSRRLQEANVQYTLDAVRLAERLGCSVFVGAGSQAEYGPKQCDLTPDMPAAPVTEYGRAKLAAGAESRRLCGQLGIRHCWVRILSVYGPFDGEDTMVMSSIRKLLAGEKPSYTKAEQQWDYLYSEDAAEALRLVAERGGNGAVYCLGSGSRRPLREYIFEIRDCINSDLVIGIGEIPYPQDRGRAVMYLCADITALRRDTGFAPAVTFEEGIRRTVAWYRQQKRGM